MLLQRCSKPLKSVQSVQKKKKHKRQHYTDLDADAKQQDWKTTEKCGAVVLEPHPP